MRIAIAVWVVAALAGSARAETVDIATFTPPKGWQRGAQNGAVQYTTLDASKKTFALFVVMPSVASTGDVAKDFAAAWNDLVTATTKIAKPTQGPAPAKTAKGLPVYVGAAQTTERGITAATLVAIVIANGRVVRVLAKANSPDGLTALDAVVQSIEVGSAPATGATPSSDELQFTAPAGWTAAQVGNETRLTDPTGTCMLAILPLQASGKSTDDDADAAFTRAFAGWKREREGNSPYRKISKGISGDGWEFTKVDSFLSRPAAGGPDPFAQQNLYALAFAAKSDSGTAIIIGSRLNATSTEALGAMGTSTPLCLDEYAASDWPDFFHSLHFKSWKAQPNAFAQRIVGKWWAGSSRNAIGYVFAANGHYQRIVGWENFRRVDSATVEVTTTGFTGNGKYKLDGATLTLYPDKGKPEVKRVRMQATEELDAWHELLYIQEPTPEGGRVEPSFRRDK